MYLLCDWLSAIRWLVRSREIERARRCLLRFVGRIAAEEQQKSSRKGALLLQKLSRAKRMIEQYLIDLTLNR